MANDDLLAKGRALVQRVVGVLTDVGVKVLGSQPGSLLDDRRGGHFATASVTLTGDGALKLAHRLTGNTAADSTAADALRFAWHQRHLGGVITSDERSDNVGVTQLTEGVVEALTVAVLAGGAD